MSCCTSPSRFARLNKLSTIRGSARNHDQPPRDRWRCLGVTRNPTEEPRTLQIRLTTSGTVSTQLVSSVSRADRLLRFSQPMLSSTVPHSGSINSMIAC